MKIDWKVSAIAAGSAFFLSVLVGVIGNVSFGTLILRALIAALLFGAGAIGVVILIDRFLPELRRAPSGVPESGNSVDIVVEGGEDFEPSGAPGMVEEPLGDNEAGAGSDDSGLLEEVEEGDGGGESAVVETAQEMDEVGEDSGALPSVDSMSDSFTEVPLGEESVTDVSDSGGDPALMAQAIRTVLKREE